MEFVYASIMSNFVTFDDGLSYVAISEIKSFHLDETDESRRTLFIHRDGQQIYNSRPISETAELLGSLNLGY